MQTEIHFVEGDSAPVLDHENFLYEGEWYTLDEQLYKMHKIRDNGIHTMLKIDSEGNCKRGDYVFISQRTEELKHVPQP